VATFLVLQHIACEPPGAFEDVLRERGHDLVRLELDEGGALPADASGFAGIVAMGGPMGVYETAEHPWLAGELAFLRAAVEGDVPYWGACLGAQLLAGALGGEVAPGPAPEVGVLDVTCTPAAADDLVFADAPASFPVLQWHGDTFTLPAGAVRLASSAAYREQAFRVRRAYGIQFHVEASPAMLAEWAAVPSYAESLDRVLGPGSLPGLLAEASAASGPMQELARALFARWLDRVVAA
jgi:GMP synthase (glutamine-hydrolysing)